MRDYEDQNMTAALAALRQELSRLQEKRQGLQSDLEIWERLERHELNRRYAEAYMEWEKQTERGAAEREARRRVDELAAQGGQLFDTLELLHSPAQSKDDIVTELAAVERELARIWDELARAGGGSAISL